MRLMVSPLIGMAPLTISAQGLVRDPRQELLCPDFTWDWGDGCRSEHQADCDPYILIEDRPKRYSTLRVEHKYRLPGNYIIRFTVADAMTKRSQTRQIEVKGGLQ